MRTDVCAVEWDGQQFLGVTIDIYCYIFVVEDFDPFDLSLHRSYQHCQTGWCRSGGMDFEPRPDLLRLATKRAMECWQLFTLAHDHSPEHCPACQLFYDSSQEVFDYRQDIAALVAGIAPALDMNEPLNRRSE
ncbi:MAG: hypothetical protein AAB619_00475 [Patescibacteria group bacterium]